MKRFLAILFLVFILIGFSVFEEFYNKTFLKTLNTKAEQVSVVINKNENNLNVNEVNDKYNVLKDFWQKSKNTLCYFTNYEKIKSIDESFVKLETAIKHNDISLAAENIAVIKEYSEFFKYIMGFSLSNLF